MTDGPAEAFASTDSAAPEWYYDASSQRYMVQDAVGNWIHMTPTDFGLLLQSRGYRKFCDKEAGETMSPLDAEKLQTVLNRRVDYCGRLAGRHCGHYVFDDTQCLVTHSPRLIEPTPPPKGDLDGWPTLREFFSGLLAPEGEEDQLPYLYGWWQHMLRALYSGRPVRGMALVLAGEKDCGKTLLKDLIKITAGNREVYPYAYMLGRDQFNKELTEAVIWTVDDVAADTTHNGRSRFGAEIKQVVANTAMRCRGMHRDGITVEPLRRLVICLNAEPDKLLVLPELNDDMDDKLLILKGFYSADAVPRGSEHDKRARFDAFVAELPRFLYWLLNDFAVDPTMAGRFGIRPYCHPHILLAIHEISPERKLLDLIDRAKIYNVDRYWRGRASDLRTVLLDEDAGSLSREDRKDVPPAAWIGRRLKKLAKFYPKRVIWGGEKNNGGDWTIRAEDFGQDNTAW